MAQVKAWDNIFYGLTFGLGLVGATVLLRYANNLIGNPIDERYLVGEDVAAREYMPYYEEYGYVEEVNPQPDDIDLLLRADDRFNPGLNYAYQTQAGQADLRTNYQEDDINGIGAYNPTESPTM